MLRRHLNALLLVLVVSLVSCLTPRGAAREGEQGDLRPSMLDMFQVTRELFGYVWNPQHFSDQKNEKHILGLLDRLSEDFHVVETKAGTRKEDPGFAISLEVQQALLRDMRTRFAAGEKEYANWGLRGLSANCMSCHTRTTDPNDFLGGGPVSTDESFNGRLSAAEFLIASRQFETASASLLDLARGVMQLPGGREDALDALQLWLLIQVRVKDCGKKDGKVLRDELERLQQLNIPLETKEVIDAWDSDLRLYCGNSHATLDWAQSLLSQVQDEENILVQRQYLVRTLIATRILHQLLDSNSEVLSPQRKEAMYLLGLGYSRLPIDSWVVYGPLYLEQVVRHYPGTHEARLAFALYQESVENLATGSSGVNLEQEDHRKLEELKSLAFEDRTTADK